MPDFFSVVFRILVVETVKPAGCQINVFDWVMVSPDEITKTSSLLILKTRK